MVADGEQVDRESIRQPEKRSSTKRQEVSRDHEKPLPMACVELLLTPSA
jgi:hypothetical protein